MAQHVIQIPITESAYVDKNNPNTNFKNDKLQINGAELSPRLIALIKFNAAIPSGKRFVSGKVKAYAITGPSQSAIAQNVSLSNWNEDTVTYNTAVFSSTSWGYGNEAITLNSYIKIANITQYHLNNEQNFGITTWDGSTIEVQSTRGVNPPYIEIVYEDVSPDAPILINPIGSYKDNLSIIRFEWMYKSSVGGSQKAFDLQWSVDGVSWNTVSQTTANNYYDMPYNTLPSGNIYWRVRTYNSYDEVGPYSNTSAFYSVGGSQTPIIQSITNTARPTINWSASEQQVYQVQVLRGTTIVYDSGNIPAILEKSHKVKEFLNDGNYTAKVRVKNEYDIWSAWGELGFTVTTAKPNKPSFVIYNTLYGLQLDITPINNAIYYLVYRSEYIKDKYVCIGKTTNTKYDDNSVANNSNYKYFVRAVTAAESFQDSDIRVGSAYFKHSLIAPVSNLSDILVLKHGYNKKPGRNAQRTLRGEVVYFSGRKLGVTEYSGQIESGINLEFALKTYAEVEEFIELYDRKETVLYRDSVRKIYGNLNVFFYRQEQLGYTISFIISETDYDEGVET